MKIRLFLVGKTTDSQLTSLIEDYQNRLKHYVPFSLEVLPELRNSKSLSGEQQKTAEGEMILKAVSAAEEMILLDEHGKEFRSVEFSEYLQKKMSAGRDIVFVVGGPYGFSEAVYQRANGKISLSKMTFSHQMVRLFFVEQIYRAMTILRHEPYHHE
ncbi:MAG: 23S rRNA (pseudouridine(1915)-N(3))-methyltransferase RlmH [Paludibacteraceae bacterium]|nr:23S rRNA (pseudouridine(1915)-N(3))-methyltransferase RlmH [Paludibacteraceae bacterium]